jgi:raffinose/stachyose/melibiose transport system permease protein
MINIWSPRFRNRTLLVYFTLLLGVILILGPLFLIVITSFKTEKELLLGVFNLPTTLNLDNFIKAWDVAKFGIYFRSSVIVVLPVATIGTLLSILSGYALGVLKPFGNRVLFVMFLIGIAVPFEGMIIPLYYRLNALKMINTYWALILPQIAFSVAYGSFWMQAFFLSLPRELIDAAAIDGAGHWQTLWKVLIPLSRPSLLSLIVLLSIWTWNEFLLVIVMATKDEVRTLPVGLAYFQSLHRTQVPLQAAGSLIVALPMIILFIIFQRDFIRGVIAGSVRG